jgi:uncharacterized protein YndB with AHSA1/START domain
LSKPDNAADRELHAETVIDAPVEKVWEVLTDLSRMPEWSTELVKMVPLKRGGLRVGPWYLGLNRRGKAIWPTRTLVTAHDPQRQVAWHTATSGATWIYDLSAEGEGTRVVHRRPVPRLTLITRAYSPIAFGGASVHADLLEQDMGVTLSRIKAAVEGR